MKLTIFDLGGVCVFNFQTIGKMARKYHIDEEVLLSEYMKDDEALMKGLLTTDAWWRKMAALFSVDSAANPLADEFAPYPNTPVLETIREMRKRGLRVVCGSNTTEPHWVRMNEAGHLESLFDACYLSQRMHLAKPDPAFFTAILRAEKVAPSDVLFIDDTPENVRAAESLDIHTLLFQNTFSWSAVDKLRSLVLEEKD